MSERREKRVKERIERRKSLGKKIKFNYRLMVHDIIERENEYILVGEAYYPRYRSTSSTYGRSVAGFGGFGGVPNSFNPYFIGYRYTHAVVVGFSKSGDIIWDNSFEINDVQTPVLREFVNVTVDEDGDKIVLLYLYDNTIRSKIIQGDKILEGITFNPVKLSFESDEARSTDKEVEGLEKWYDNKLFGYGKQKIKNLKDKDVKLNRRIFYINKIEYEKGLSFQ